MNISKAHRKAWKGAIMEIEYIQSGDFQIPNLIANREPGDAHEVRADEEELSEGAQAVCFKRGSRGEHSKDKTKVQVAI